VIGIRIVGTYRGRGRMSGVEMKVSKTFLQRGRQILARLGRRDFPPGCPQIEVKLPSCSLPGSAGHDPVCVKTLHGITAPVILRLVVSLRAKKCKNSSSARHYDQISFRFYTG
jgi:hypothetical protein